MSTIGLGQGRFEGRPHDMYIVPSGMCDRVMAKSLYQKKKADQSSLQFTTLDIMLSLPKAVSKAGHDESTAMGIAVPNVITYKPEVGDLNITQNHLNFGVGCVAWAFSTMPTFFSF